MRDIDITECCGTVDDYPAVSDKVQRITAIVDMQRTDWSEYGPDLLHKPARDFMLARKAEAEELLRCVQRADYAAFVAMRSYFNNVWWP